MANELTEYLRSKLQEAENSFPKTIKELDTRRATERKNTLIAQAIERKKQEAEASRQNKIIGRLEDANRDLSAGEILSDNVDSLKKGAVGLAGIGYGLADLVSRFNPVTLGEAIYNKQTTGVFDAPDSRSLDEISAETSADGKAISQKLTETRNNISAGQSDKLIAQRELIQEASKERALEKAQQPRKVNRTVGDVFSSIGDDAQEFGEVVGDYIDNPAAIMDTTLESLPQMFVPGAAAKPLVKGMISKKVAQSTAKQSNRKISSLAKEINSKKEIDAFLKSKKGAEEIRKVQEMTGVGFTVASEGISNGLEVQSEILSSKHKDLLESSPEYKKLISEGMSPLKAKRSLADKASLITTGIAGLFAGVSSKVSGAGELEGKLFKIDSKIGKNIITKIASAGSKEGIEETLQGASGQYASNVGKKQTVNPNQSLSEGVIDAAAQGLVAGVASGGGLAGVANLPKAASTTVDTTKKVAKAGVNKVVDQAIKNTGVSPEAREAIKTGNTDEVLSKTKEGNYVNPQDAMAVLADTPVDHKDSTAVKGRINELSVGLKQLIDSYGPKDKRTTKQNIIIEKHGERIRELTQVHLGKVKPEVEKFVKDIDSGKAKASAETSDGVNKANNTFSNTPLTSPGERDTIIKQAETILKSGLANEEQAARLESTIKTAKTYEAVTHQVFNGAGTKFTGINVHKQNILSALETGAKELADVNLTRLTSFKDKHTKKLEQINTAFEAHKRIGKDGIKTRENLSTKEQEAIKLAESRVGSNGKTFSINNNTIGLIRRVEKEVDALNTVTNEMSSLVNTTPAAQTSTKTKETPVPKTKPAVDRSDVDSLEASIPNTDTDSSPSLQDIEDLNSELNRADSKVTTKPAQDTSKPTKGDKLTNLEASINDSIKKKAKSKAPKEATETTKADKPKVVKEASKVQTASDKEVLTHIKKTSNDVLTEQVRKQLKNKNVTSLTPKAINNIKAALRNGSKLKEGQKKIVDALRNEITTSNTPKSTKTNGDIVRNHDTRKPLLVQANTLGIEIPSEVNRAPKTKESVAFLKGAIKETLEGIKQTSINKAKLSVQERFDRTANSIAKDSNVEFVDDLKDKSGIHTRFAQSNSKTGKITIRNLSQKDLPSFIKYITGKDDSVTSRQKSLVLDMLDGVTTDELTKMFTHNADRITEFLYQHELSHIDNNDAKVYFNRDVRDSNGKLTSINYLSEDKLLIEARATADALNRMGVFDNEITVGTPTYNLNTKLAAESTSSETHENKTFKNEGSSSHINEFYQLDKSDKDNLFQTVENLFENIKETDQYKELSEEEQKAFETVIEFESEFTDTLLKEMNGKPTKFLYQDSVQFFLKEGYQRGRKSGDISITRDDIDPNILSAIAMAGLNWINTNAVKDPTNGPRDINSILGRDSKVVPTPYEYTLLAGLGTNLNVSMQGVGPDMLKIVGLKAKDDTSLTVTRALENSIGNHVAHALAKMDITTIQSINPTIIDMLKADAPREGIEDTISNLGKSPRGQAQSFYVHPNSKNDKDDNQVLADEVTKFSDVIRGNPKLLTNLFGLKNRAITPQFTKPTKVTKTIKNSIMETPEAIQDSLKKVEETEYGIVTDAVEMDKYLDELSILVDGYNPDYKTTTHESEHKGIEGKNSTLINERRHYKEFMIEVEKQDSKDPGVYFTYDVWKSMRMGMAPNTFNIQTSHMHRSFLGVKSHRSTIDTTNKKHMRKFMIAMGGALGVKTEQKFKGAAIKEVLDLFDPTKSDKAVALNGAIEAIYAMEAGDNSTENKMKIIKGVQAGGENRRSLDGLIAYAKMLKANQKDVKGTFETALFREPDGIANGVAISLLQFPVKTKNLLTTMGPKLARVGIYLDNTTSFNEFSSNKGQDSYRTMAKEWNTLNNELRHFLTGAKEPGRYGLENRAFHRGIEQVHYSYNNPAQALDAVSGLIGSFINTEDDTVTTLARNLVKNPQMITNFGAAITKVVDTFADSRILAIYKNIAEAHVKGDQQAIIDIVNHLNAAKSRSDKSIINVNAVLANPLKWTMSRNQERSLKSLITATYGTTLEIAIQREFKDSIEARRIANAAMAVAFKAFKMQYDKKFNALVKANDGDLPSKKEFTELNTSMLDAMPVFKGVFSTDSTNGFLVAKNDIFTDKDNPKSKTTSPFNSVHDISKLNINTQTYDATDKGANTVSSYASIPTWKEAGVSGPITGIHNIDAATMLKVIENFEASNIHDAAIFSILEADEGSRALNESFIKTNKEQSVMRNLRNTYRDTLVYMHKHDPSGYKALVKEVNESETLGGKHFNGRKMVPRTFRELDKHFLAAAKENESARTELFKHIKTVHQYADSESSAVSMDDVITKFTRAQADKLINDDVKADLDVFRSEVGTEDFVENFRATQEREVTDKTSEVIYDDLGVDDFVKDSPEHDTHLRGVLNKLINKVIKPTKLFIEEKGDVNQGVLADNGTAVYMSNALPTRSSVFTTNMSQRETYVHELLHRVSHAAIDGNSQAAKKLRRFYLEIKNAKNADGSKWLTGEDFLAPGANRNNPIEMALAQERYDYIFGDKITRHGVEVIDPITGKRILDPITGKYKRTTLSNAHHEFLVIGVTNEAFIKKLATYESRTKKAKKEDSTWLDRFTAFIDELFTWLNDKITGTRKGKGDTVLHTLAGQLAGVDNKAREGIWTQMEKTSDIIGEGFNKIASGILAPFNYLVTNKRIARSKNNAVKLVRKTLKTVPYLDQYPAAIQTVRDASGITKESIWSAMLHEIRGRDQDNTYLYDLSRESSNMLDKLRLKTATHIKQFITEKYLTDVTTEEKEALTHGLIMTDIDSLFPSINGETVRYDGKKLERLFSDPTYLNAEITKVVNNIEKGGFGKNAIWYRDMAKSLGTEMATGRPTEQWSVMNANSIAELDNTGLEPIGNLNKAEILIDQLATLQAIKTTDDDSKELTAKVIKAEFAESNTENGILTTLAMHRENKKSAMDVSFKGQKKLFVKGYIKEQFAQNRSFTVAPESFEAELLKEGFTKETAVRKDPKDPNQADMFIYTSNLPQPKYLSGIMSTTSKKAKGTPILEVYSQLDVMEPGQAASLDRPTITARKKAQIKAITEGKGVKVKDTDGVLAPIFNHLGEIVDYRYKMDEATKKRLIGRDDAIDVVLGAMEASIDDKRNTEIINDKTIKETFKYYTDNAKDNNRGYVEIGPNSNDPKFQEVYRLLPDDAKETIRKVWGGDAMFVRAEEASFIFGERELNLSRIQRKDVPDGVPSMEWLSLQMNNGVAYLLNRKSIKYAESFFKELISMVKDAIVIKSGGVLIGNVVSNAVLLKVLGVSVKDMTKYHAEAFVAIKQHRKDTTELDNLELEVRLDKSKARKHKNRIQELKDSILRNPVTTLIDAGMFQPIVEDVNLLNDSDNYTSRLEDWLSTNKVTSTVLNNTPDIIKDAGKHLVMAHDTAPYKFMRDMTQVSDFIARYTLHKHNEKKGMDSKDSIDMITDMFINYTPPTHRYIQYANDMGLVMFTKFFFRIQKVLFHLAKERPGSLLASLVGQGAMFDVPDVTESFVLGGLDGKVNNPLGVVKEIVDAPATVLGELLD
jgi:hypothetical protein